MFPRLQNRINSEMVMDKVTRVTFDTDTSSYDMTAYDHVVIATCDGASGAVNLPPVAEAAGQMYLIYLADHDTNKTVDVKSQGDELTGETDICAVADDANTVIDVETGAELSAAGEYVLMMSTGLSWHILASHAIALTT